jgi:hypothetical protein
MYSVLCEIALAGVLVHSSATRLFTRVVESVTWACYFKWVSYSSFYLFYEKDSTEDSYHQYFRLFLSVPFPPSLFLQNTNISAVLSSHVPQSHSYSHFQDYLLITSHHTTSQLHLGFRSRSRLQFEKAMLTVLQQAALGSSVSEPWSRDGS